MMRIAAQSGLSGRTGRSSLSGQKVVSGLAAMRYPRSSAVRLSSLGVLASLREIFSVAFAPIYEAAR